MLEQKSWGLGLHQLEMARLVSDAELFLLALSSSSKILPIKSRKYLGLGGKMREYSDLSVLITLWQVYAKLKKCLAWVGPWAEHSIEISMAVG